MKFLQIPAFEKLNELLSFETPSGLYVNGRIEVYSCKAAGVDKKLYRYLESKYSEDVFESKSLSPEQHYINTTHSPFGPLSELSSRKVLFYLIATLNASFQDYDFRSLLPDNFIRHNSISSVINTINTTLFNLGGSNYLKQNSLWEEVDNAITLEDCQVYAYNPDSESDPYGDELPVWSFNLFFFNRKLKRILFFTCRCSSESLNHIDSASSSGFALTPGDYDSASDVFVADMEVSQECGLS
ncbi:Repressor of RNA polymerase III transcription maf1 [Smittium mucronatum]|uniref:Repressor of RNA polymerase III transcription MAF1 n=1 Tax=Smittium mucronatum TaxID=133383 RepID=A0A1R0GU30_9FUNG|nr:Repressor of RNA polymerase III transcription maf1 [Smittium mucronatum]